MEVKIVKSSKDSYWYANKIGAIYDVCGVEDDIYLVRKFKEGKLWRYDVAPVLKEDCDEIYLKSVVEPPRQSNGKKKPDRTANLYERSGLNTGREISMYEQLNKEADIKVYIKEIDNP